MNFKNKYNEKTLTPEQIINLSRYESDENETRSMIIYLFIVYFVIFLCCFLFIFNPSFLINAILFLTILISVKNIMYGVFNLDVSDNNSFDDNQSVQPIESNTFYMMEKSIRKKEIKKLNKIVSTLNKKVKEAENRLKLIEDQYSSIPLLKNIEDEQEEDSEGYEAYGETESEISDIVNDYPEDNYEENTDEEQQNNYSENDDFVNVE